MADAVQGSAGAKALAMVSQARGKLQALPSALRMKLFTAALGIASVVAGMVWYSGRPDYRVLFNGLEGKDVAQVAQELGAAGIPFQMTPDGSGVQVPAESLDKARMEVAAKGMPATGRLGFELFDKPNWVGSEFDERVNYQRALEGELEHTIGTLGVVRSARVHLVLPQQSLFTSEEKLAKASVVLKLKRPSLDPEQTESIRNLVAGAVENLNPAQVTLVDADGRVDLQAKGRGAQAGDEERALEGRLLAMLEPLAGAGNIRATVNVSYDEASTEKTDEVYDPTQTALVSSEKTEQTSGQSRAAQGVPGTASNTPAAAPAGAVQGSTQAAAPGTPPLLQPLGAKDGLPVFPQNNMGGGQSSRQESGTYAVTRHLTHTEAGPGRVRRITAAVVVNDRMTSEGAGKSAKTTWKPRSAEEMHRLEELAQAAVGFDDQRGDQVVMENVSFSSNAPEVPAAGMDKMLEQARVLIGSQSAMPRTIVTGLLGALVVLFVLRPVARQMAASMQPPLLATDTLRGAALDESRAFSHSARRQDSELGESSGGAAQQELAPRIFDEVSDHIKRDPAHSTRLIEAWIASEDD